ncbi:DUF4083 domain-containing protein [Peribacillus frigoritolerans]|uniref:DUF4083 domain-containing protein n=1 Tax=Peribacillus frigoritolerans TaxID=450367 RepID=UPI0024C1009A|nr:DUF4083 domain-containing protein [Peribacillus frigoritolerans]WHX66002.1 DUF4083 domain-containing protein [Peribacillus frigoritolerans]
MSYLLDIRKEERRKKWGYLGINIGDLVYQLIMFILLLGMIFAVYFFVRSLLARSNKSNSIEQKLDRVIELLEKDKRE